MKQKKIGNKKINVWKWLFLLILAINIAFIGVVASRIVEKREPSATTTSTTSSSDIQVGTFTTTKEELNNTIAAYLKKYQSKKLTYQVTVASSAILFEGTYTLLGYQVPLYVYFEPVKLSSGAVQLQVTSVSAGTLSLPVSDILTYIKSSYDLPDFVEVKPKKSVINLNLQKLKDSQNIYLKATSIDLVNDNISFDIFKKNS